VIHNKTVPLSILRRLAKHPDPKIRWAVALKRKLDEELFLELSQDSDEDIRRRIAYNQKTPKSILEILINDKSEHVAEAARKRLEEMNHR
jgi:isopentenyldiphosphate isomerase